ncbi:MmyB family transcriptional regulator [Roseobacteraceae bacterium NS-SX3]
MAADFGGALKEWRQIRRMSQMDMAGAAGVSPRHVSFLETGRARPSRGMVLRLCEVLLLPQAAANTLLVAAGLAPAYGARQLNAADMAPLRASVDWMLERHAPYPAMALDRHWRLEAMNAPAAGLMAAAGIAAGHSLLEALLENGELRARIENLGEVERLTLARLRSELAHFGRDPVLEAAAARLQERTVSGGAEPAGVLPPVIPARYRMGDRVLSFFSAISQFGTVEDIALSELRVECLFPADEETRAFLAG